MEVSARNNTRSSKTNNNIRNDKAKNRFYLNLNNNNSLSGRNNSNSQNNSSALEDSDSQSRFDNNLYYNKNLKHKKSPNQKDALDRPLQNTLQRAINKAICQSSKHTSNYTNSFKNSKTSPKGSLRPDDYGFFKQKQKVKPQHLQNFSNSSNQNNTPKILSPVSTQLSQQSNTIKFSQNHGYQYEKEQSSYKQNKTVENIRQDSKSNTKAKSPSLSPSQAYQSQNIQQILKNDPKKIQIQLQTKQDMKLQKFSEISSQFQITDRHSSSNLSSTCQNNQPFHTSRSSILMPQQLTDIETQNFLKKNFVSEKILLKNFLEKLFIEYKDIISDNQISEEMIDDLKHQIGYNLCQREDEDLVDMQKLQAGTKRLGLLGLVLDGLKDFNEQERSRLQGLRTSEVIDMKEEIQVIQGKDVRNIQNVLQEFMESLYKGMENEIYQKFNFEMRRMVLKFKETEKILSIVQQKVTDNFDLFKQESINRKLIRDLRDENCLLRENTLILENEVQKCQLQIDLLNNERIKLEKENEKLGDRSDKYCQQILNISQNQIHLSNKKSQHESPCKQIFNVSPQHCNINIFDDENRSPLRTFQTNQNKSPFKQQKPDYSFEINQITEFLIKNYLQQNVPITQTTIQNFCPLLIDVQENQKMEYLQFFNKLSLDSMIQNYQNKNNISNHPYKLNMIHLLNTDDPDENYFYQDIKVQNAIQKCLQISGIDKQIDNKNRKCKKRYGTELLDDVTITSNILQDRKNQLIALLCILQHSTDQKILKICSKNIQSEFEKSYEENTEIQDYLLKECQLINVLFITINKNRFQPSVIENIFEVLNSIDYANSMINQFIRSLPNQFIINNIAKILDSSKININLKKYCIYFIQNFMFPFDQIDLNIKQLKNTLVNLFSDKTIDIYTKDSINLILKNKNY